MELVGLSSGSVGAKEGFNPWLLVSSQLVYLLRFKKFK